jgi:hypothetical protein
MNAPDELEEYRAALRAEVCSHCIERRPSAPPCGPLGKGCGLERHLAGLVQICRTTDSVLIDPYIEKLHETICTDCEYKDTAFCPCPLNYLLQLAVQAVEKVERNRANDLSAASSP